MIARAQAFSQEACRDVADENKFKCSQTCSTAGMTSSHLILHTRPERAGYKNSARSAALSHPRQSSVGTGGFSQSSKTAARIGVGSRMREEIRHLVVRMKIENPGWRFEKIQAALREVRHRVCESTVRSILRERHRTCTQTQKAHNLDRVPSYHFDSIETTDMFTVEIWTPHG